MFGVSFFGVPEAPWRAMSRWLICLLVVIDLVFRVWVGFDLGSVGGGGGGGGGGGVVVAVVVVLVLVACLLL